MRPTSLVRLMIASAVLPVSAAVAQTPAPAAPAPTSRPAPAARPAPAPRPIGFDAAIADEMHIRAAEMEVRAHEIAMRAEEASLRALDMAHLQIDHIAPVAEMAAARALADVEARMPQITAAAEMAAARLADVGMHFEPMVAPAIGFGPSQDRFERARPRAAWSQGEPADSIYRLAREALNRGEYRRAAQLFNEVTTKFKTSEYAAHSAYWEAFARYRLGTTEELKVALAILDAKNEVTAQLQSMRRESNIDVPALRARIQGALAARGDEAAARALRSEANQANGCDREEVSVRAEALSALGQMDVNAAMPAVRKVLANRDECTVELRRRALYLLGRENVEGRNAIFLDVAKNDSDPGIRGEAMSWLARTADANAVPMLQELLRTTDDERTQRSAVSALGMIDNDAARRAIRTIIEREDAAERVRIEAINAVTRKRGEDRLPSTDDVNYLRQLYPKLTSTRLRQAVLQALGRVETAENKQFFQSIVRNTNESSSVRASAMQRLGGMLTLEELTRMYDVADARSLREQILYALYERKEPESVDKMIDIARKDTDPQIRRHAITLLARRKDPRAQQLLQELIER